LRSWLELLRTKQGVDEIDEQQKSDSEQQNHLCFSSELPSRLQPMTYKRASKKKAAVAASSPRSHIKFSFHRLRMSPLGMSPKIRATPHFAFGAVTSFHRYRPLQIFPVLVSTEAVLARRVIARRIRGDPSHRPRG
jgi:hypothetical protein